MEFASKLGIHKNTIGKWERGESVPDANNLAKILNTYPWVDPAWLLTGEGEMRREVTETPSWVQDIENKNFITHAKEVDYYLESEHYKEITATIRGLIYSRFHDHVKKAHGWTPFVIASIISEFYKPSFTLHDYDITDKIFNLVEIRKTGGVSAKSKNVEYWQIFDEISERFCDKKIIAPNSVKKEIINWINWQISKESKTE